MRISAFWFLILSASCAVAAQNELRDGCDNTREIKEILGSLHISQELAENIQTILESTDCTASTIDQISSELATIESRLEVIAAGSDSACCGAAQQAESLLEVIANNMSAGCCSQIEQLFTILEEADSILSSKIENLAPSACCGLVEQSLSLVQEINVSVEELLGCGAIQVTGFTTPITAPGNYCLANNISGATLVIRSDDVNLDLNGFTITTGGTALIISAANVTVRNGFINSTSMGSTTTVSISNAPSGILPRNVHLEDITISLSGTLSQGIVIQASGSLLCDSIVMDSIKINGGGSSVVMNAVTNSIIRNSEFTNYASTGVFINTACNGNRIENCVATGGTADKAVGFWLNAGALSNLLIDCVASNNTSGGDNTGFLLGDVSDAAGDNNYLIGCIADANDVGFEVAPATGTQLFKGCIATNNIVLGFAEAGGPSTGVQYLNNVSKFNGATPGNSASDTNYNSQPIGSPPYFQKMIPFSSNNPVSYWTNVTLP